MLGLALAACSPAGSGPVLDRVNATDAAPPSCSVIKMQVSGDQDTALVAANVVTGDGTKRVGSDTADTALHTGIRPAAGPAAGQSLTDIFVVAQ